MLLVLVTEDYSATVPPPSLWTWRLWLRMVQFADVGLYFSTTPAAVSWPATFLFSCYDSDHHRHLAVYCIKFSRAVLQACHDSMSTFSIFCCRYF